MIDFLKSVCNAVSTLRSVLYLRRGNPDRDFAGNILPDTAENKISPDNKTESKSAANLTLGKSTRVQDFKTLQETASFNGSLDLASDISAHIVSSTLNQIGFLDSVGLCEKKLPGKNDLCFQNPKTKEELFFDDLNIDFKRLFIINKFFKGDIAKYLQTFKEKLHLATKDVFQKEIEALKGNKAKEVIDYLSAESLQEFPEPSINDPGYETVKQFAEENPEIAIELVHYMTDGQRYFCRLINNGVTASDDPVIALIDSSIKESPESFLKFIKTLSGIIESKTTKKDNQLLLLKKLQDKIKETIHSGITACDLQTSSNEINTEDQLRLIEQKVTNNIAEALKQEEKIIGDLEKTVKLAQRRKFLIWTGAGIVTVATGGSGLYVANLITNNIYFNNKVASIEEKIRPYREINYTSFYNQAINSLRAFPIERRDPVNRTNADSLDIWIHQTHTVDTQGFRRVIGKDFVKPLAVLLAPQLPPNINLECLPNHLRNNLSNCLRGLIPQNVWGQKMPPLFGSVLEERFPVPTSDFIFFLQTKSAYKRPNPDGSGPLVDEVDERITIRNNLTYYANQRQLRGKERDRFINDHLEPRDFITVDPRYVAPTEALRIITEAINKRKFEILISGPLTDAAYQEVIRTGVNTNNYEDLLTPEAVTNNFERFKGYSILKSLIHEFDRAKDQGDIKKIEELEPLIDESIRFNDENCPRDQAQENFTHLAFCEADLQVLNRAREIRYEETRRRNTWRARRINEPSMYADLINRSSGR